MAVSTMLWPSPALLAPASCSTEARFGWFSILPISNPNNRNPPRSKYGHVGLSAMEFLWGVRYDYGGLYDSIPY